jgi:hypothetical protein
MTTRRPTSGVSGQAERPATKAELERIEERRHVESVLHQARRIRWPVRSHLSKRPEQMQASPTTPDRKEPRPPTPAEKERIDERRHVENVMRSARRSRLHLRKSPLPARASGSGVQGAVPTPASGASPRRPKRTVVVLAVGAVLACALLGLLLSVVIGQAHLAARLSALQRDTAQWRQEEQQAIARVEQSLQGLAATQTNLQTNLQTVVNGESQLNAKITALETARSADVAQQQQKLASLEKSTQDGLAQVASRLDSEDSLAASVRKLLPGLNPGEPTTQTPSASVSP